jgi:peptidoglycan/LPS O-acetylase OafA/YrhL
MVRGRSAYCATGVHDSVTSMEEPLASKELANLDCLRSFAVLAVLIDHLEMLLASAHGRASSEFFVKLGQLGVLAFFVHTSLVLMFSLQRLQPEGGRLAPRFYIRRVFRIYPLAVFCIFCVLLFRIPAVPLFGQEFEAPSRAVVVGNLLLIQNVIGRASITGPLWSLPFEIEMYAVLPALFAIAVKRRALLYLAAMLALASTLAWVVKTATGHANILAYAPCFLAGVTAYVLRLKIRPFLPAVGWPWFTGLWLALSTGAMLRWSAVQLPISWLACLVLGVSIYAFHDSVNPIWNALTRTVAKYSFGIYLSHIPMMWLVFRVWRVENDVAASLLWLALTGAASVAGFHLIEHPMIGVGRQLSSARMFSIPALAAAQSELR